MKEFFSVTALDDVLGMVGEFAAVSTETVSLMESLGRVLAEQIVCRADLPGFARSTMDGFAVRAASTFGVSEGNPGYFALKGAVAAGQVPDVAIGPGEAARVATGGMLPRGADSVVMIEHAESLDATTIEVYRSVAPGQHVVAPDEDFSKGEVVLSVGCRIRPQEVGLLAAFGRETVLVFCKPLVGIISTGDEVVSVDQDPGPGQIRDVNTFTLSALVAESGATPKTYGIVKDQASMVSRTLCKAHRECDMVLISGGSSVGARDFTVEALSSLPDARIMVHGITISPGKPTILASAGGKALWGLPGHVVSAMVVFRVVVRPFIQQLAGLLPQYRFSRTLSALLSRNVASAQGRIDFVRVRLLNRDGQLRAEPILGKSGLLHTMIRADGLVSIGMNTEGLNAGSRVEVIPMVDF